MDNLGKSDYISYLKNRIKNLKQEIDWLKNLLKDQGSSLLYSIKEPPVFIKIDDWKERYFEQIMICLFKQPDENMRHFIGVVRDKEKGNICYKYFINNDHYLDMDLSKQILLEMHRKLIEEVTKDDL